MAVCWERKNARDMDHDVLRISILHVYAKAYRTHIAERFEFLFPAITAAVVPQK